MLLNVYKNKNNIPPLQGNYLISALPCHCKPLLSASAPSQPLIPRVFQLFPHFQDVSAPKSVPDPKRCHPRLGDTVGWGAESSSHLSAPPAPLSSPSPSPPAPSPLTWQPPCPAVPPSAGPGSPAAPRSCRGPRARPPARSCRPQPGSSPPWPCDRPGGAGAALGRQKLQDWGSRTKFSPRRGQIFNCGSEQG